MRKNLCFIYILCLIVCIPLSGQERQSLIEKLYNIPQVKEIQKLESRHYDQKFMLRFEQPVDPKDPGKGKFTQRVFLFHVDDSKPMVMVTEGYGAEYASRPAYREEIATMLGCNLLVVEHRYFLQSTPRHVDWEYFNAENAASDHHNVFEAFKPIYPQKWIATGISKGGQTAMMYRAFYPDDVDITVPYVAPLCRGVEDGRHEPFLSEFVGTKEEREKIQNFQTELFKRKDQLIPLLDSVVVHKNGGYRFYNIPIAEIFDYCALEYPFALWQWGTPVERIPALNSSDSLLFAHFMSIAGPDYLVNQNATTPFFIQAAKELGYYGYDVEPFKEYVNMGSAKGYIHRIFIPKEMNITFDPSLYEKVAGFIKNTNAKMMFIYGEFDPWSAVKVDDPKKKNIKIFIEPGGSHRARINTLPEKMKKEAVSTLEKWLKE